MTSIDLKSNGSKRWGAFLMSCFLVTTLVVGGFVTGGCESSSSKTSVTKESTSTPSSSQTVVVEKETKKVDEGDRGVIGGIFHVIGEIIALPFQLVADLFRAIF
ncbi:MAG: hypothetical protein HYZ84_00540 [Candidatus Omnitrophica bacterium]|nr:hypothetical protein [Candidatus Omnitrophota bacterium]